MYKNKMSSFIAPCSQTLWATLLVLFLTACGGGVADHFSQNAPNPPAPTLAANERNQWFLSWENSASAQQYLLYWSENSELENANEVLIETTESQVDVLDLAKESKIGSPIYFAISAIWEGKVGQKSAVFEYRKQPSPPTELAQISARGRNTISWKANSGVNPEEKFNVYWSTSAKVSINNFDAVQKGITGNLFINDNQTYEGKSLLYYVVTVEREGVESVASNVIAANIITIDSNSFVAPPTVTVEATGILTTSDLGAPTMVGFRNQPTVENDAPIDGFPLGTHRVEWMTVDDYDDTLTDTQIVIIVDSTKPTLTAPPPINVETVGDSITLSSLGDALASDIFPVTISNNAPDSLSFSVGMHTVEWVARDVNNNVQTIDQLITVTKAQLVCNAPPAIQVEASGELTIVPLDILGTANANGFDVPSLVVTHDLPNTGLSLGEYNINWTCRDALDNTKSSIQNVRIQDRSKPIFTSLLPPLSYDTFSDNLVLPLIPIPSVMDIFPVKLTSNAPDPLRFELGTNIVIWTATDSSGNSVTLNQQITIAKSALVCSAPDGVSIEANGVLSVPSISDLGVVTSLGFDPNSISITNDVPEAGYALGAHTIRWVCEDEKNNVKTARQSLTISDTTVPMFDPELPTINQVTLSNDYLFQSLSAPTVTDIFSVNLRSDAPDPLLFPVGETIVTWTAEDANGNTSTQTQLIVIEKTPLECIVTDNIRIEAKGPLTVLLPEELGDIAVNGFEPESLTITNDIPNSGFPLGQGSINWTCADNQNNTKTVLQSLNVVDTTPPVFLTELTLITEETPSKSFTFSSLPEPETSDIFSVSLSHDAPEPLTFALGSFVVTWTAEDDSGNKATLKQNITISKAALVCEAPSDKIFEATAALTNPSMVELGQVTSRGFDDISLVITNDLPDTGFPLGTHQINWRCVDDQDNLQSSVQSISIEDTTKPKLSDPVDPAPITAKVGEKSVTVPVGSVTAKDLVSDEKNITIEYAPKGPFPLGVTLITWIATDESGNQASAIQTVKVLPYEPQNLLVKKITNSTLQIAWDLVPGATSYTVYWTSQTDHGELPIRGNSATQVENITDNSFTQSNLSPFSLYHYIVSATNEAGEGSVTTVLSQYTGGTLPVSIAYYSFDGDASDQSGNGLDGVVSGAALSSDKAGGQESAYSFNGTSDKISVDYNPLLDIIEQITLVAEIYPTVIKAQTILSKFNSIEATGPPAFGLALSAENDIIFRMRQGAKNVELKKIGYPLNQWTHVVGTYDGKTMKLYINGIIITSTPVTGPITENIGPLKIGASGKSLTNNFQGKLDEIRLYSKALTDIQIRELAGSPLAILHL